MGEQMLALAITIGLWAIYVIACLCLGSLLIRLLTVKSDHLENTSALAVLATAFLLGQGALANVWLLLALVGWFSPPLVAGLLTLCALGGVAFAWPNGVHFARQLWSALSSLWTESWPWRVLILLTLLLLSVEGVGSSLYPPYGDAVAFYMPLSKVIAASHRLVPLPGCEAATQMGLQGELHYAALMSLGSAQAAKLFVWPTSLAVAMMLLAIGSKVGLGLRGQWMALAVLFTSTAFTYLITDGKVDLFAAAMGMAAFYWALQTGGRQGTLALRLTGLFTGLAVIAKISYLAVLLPGILLLVVWQCTIPSKERSVGASLIYLAMASVSLGFWMVLPVLPHLLKNGVLFGEPLAPFVSSGGQSWLSQTWYTPENTGWIVLTYPLALVLGRYPMQYGTLSPLTLAFAPLAFLLPRPRSIASSQLVQITLAAALGVAIWVIFRPSVLAPRYILSPLLAFIPLVARSAEYVVRVEAKPRWLSAGILICFFTMLLLTLFHERRYPIYALKSAIGRVSECDLAGPNCRASGIVNQQATIGDRIYLGTYYRYWLRPDLLQCISGTNELLTLYNLQTPEERWTYLYERGFRYLIIDERTHASLADLLDVGQVPAWLVVVPLFDENEYVVFRLESPDPSHQPLMTCRQVNPPAWDVVLR
jgi:hypothetical protein